MGETCQQVNSKLLNACVSHRSAGRFVEIGSPCGADFAAVYSAGLPVVPFDSTWSMSGSRPVHNISQAYTLNMAILTFC